MKNLKISSLYRDPFALLLPFLIILYTQNIYILSGCMIYVFWRFGLLKILALVILVLLVLLRLLPLMIVSDLYFIKGIKSNGYFASNLLYDVEVYTDAKLNIDEIIEVEGKANILDKDKFKNGIYYRYHTEEVRSLSVIPSLRSFLFSRYQELSDDSYKSFLGKILFDYVEYDSTYFFDISADLSVYYLFRFLEKIFKKSKFKDFLSFIAITLVCGIDYGLMRVFLFKMTPKLTQDKTQSFALACILLVLYDPWRIYSYSFIIPVLLRMVLLFRSKFDFKVVMTLIQSYFFNRTNPMMIMGYKGIMYLIIAFQVSAVAGLILKPAMPLSRFIFSFIEAIQPFLNIHFKGRITLFYIIVLYLLIKYLKIENSGLKWLLTLLFISANVANLNATISFIDVGQGDAILIRAPFGRENILIDTGNEYNNYKLQRFLDAKGVYSIDHLLITHSDSDHSGNLKELYKDYDVKNTVIDHQDVVTDNFHFYSLNQDKWDNTNDNSLVYYLNFGGIDFLFTGDISKEVEKDILSSYPGLKADILKLSHHGSKTSTANELLVYTRPKIAIASTSGQYSHSAKEVKDLLEIWQIDLYTTEDKGSISLNYYWNVNILKMDSGEFAIISE